MILDVYLNYHGKMCAATDLVPQSLQDEFIKAEIGPNCQMDYIFVFVRAPAHLFSGSIHDFE